MEDCFAQSFWPVIKPRFSFMKIGALCAENNISRNDGLGGMGDLQQKRSVIQAGFPLTPPFHILSKGECDAASRAPHAYTSGHILLVGLSLLA